MSYQPRTIAYLAEVMHPPLAPDPRAIQRLHNEFFQENDPTYTSFHVSDSGPTLSNPASRPGAVSSVSFLQDRMLFREEMGGLLTDQFAQRVRRVCERMAVERKIPVFLAQVITLRSLVNAKNRRDTREFLAKDMLRIDAGLDAFSHHPATLGLRMAFHAKSADQPSTAVRVESYNADPQSLFLETQTTYGPLVVDRGLEAIEQRILDSYDQLTGSVLDFVSRFDRPRES